jgi:hypothetical protein
MLLKNKVMFGNAKFVWPRFYVWRRESDIPLTWASLTNSGDRADNLAISPAMTHASERIRMVRFHAYTGFQGPWLYIWRDGTDFKVSVRPVAGVTVDEPGWVEFQYNLDPVFTPRVRFMLFDYDERGKPSRWEKTEHQRTLQRRADDTFSDAWFAQDASRVLTADPLAEQRETLRFHLITRQKYRPSQLFIWDRVTDEKRRLDSNDADDLGPVGTCRSRIGMGRFLFQIHRSRQCRTIQIYEPDVANRLYVAGDGGEIWTRSRPRRLRALDIGCRRGFLAEAFADLGYRVVGVDPSAVSIETAGRHATANDLDIDYRVGFGERVAHSGRRI